ncbi:hypothetical protein [Alkalicoccobacillus murimartini]|uniref:DUF2564 family protein n=1 Tax=Alkalicoccobacillus murimartini TaxID=171685 RepID=A0ABT9YE78_9BACI|nr:hypothetical protein [Alkalicoccobacillus murimartini]MDQ0206036.1 hypothetical protein [Alkalicoccobacillus murimartini]
MSRLRRTEPSQMYDVLERVEKAIRTAEQNVHEELAAMNPSQSVAAKQFIEQARADYDIAQKYYNSSLD